MAILLDVPTTVDPAMYNFLMQLKLALESIDKRLNTLEGK